MKKLPERENYIISLRFFEGKTQMEVAEEIGISQAQVSRLEKNACLLYTSRVQLQHIGSVKYHKHYACYGNHKACPDPAVQFFVLCENMGEHLSLIHI